jgi:hypothetical protein
MTSITREEDLSLSSVSCTTITSLSVSQNVYWNTRLNIEYDTSNRVLCNGREQGRCFPGVRPYNEFAGPFVGARCS